MNMHELIFASCVLCLMIGAIIGLKPFLARLNRGARSAINSDKKLVLEAHLSLDRARRLSLVRYGQKQVLILSGGASDILLDWTSTPTFDAVLEDTL